METSDMMSGWDTAESSSWTPSTEIPSNWGTGGSTLQEELFMDEEQDEEENNPEMFQEQTGSGGYYASQVSPEVYRAQTKTYTDAAVATLMQSPEYLRKTTRCNLCWSIWSEGMCTESCVECGGFTMTRPCPICSGKCGQTWTRDVEMSQSRSEAHWDGSCGLPEEEQHQYMASILMEEASEEDVLDAMQQLSTS